MSTRRSPTLSQQDSSVGLTSEPIPIDGRAGWPRTVRLAAPDRTEPPSTVPRPRHGAHCAGQPLTIDIAWMVYNGAGDTRIDSGNLHVSAAADGRSLDGKLWSNGQQAERALVLRRPR
jgi:hypothetical protein